MEPNEMQKKDAAAPKKPNKRTMQSEADELFALQMRVAENARGSDRTVIALFLSMIFVLGALILILPHKTFSEQENRVLQEPPRLQSSFSGSLIERIQAGKFLDRYFSGAFSEDVNSYYADQFPGRDFFVGLKGAVEIALFKGENNDVVLGRDGWLISRVDHPNLENVLRNYEVSAAFAERLAASKIPVTFAVAGRVADIAESMLPVLYPTADLYAPWDALLSAAAGNMGALQTVDLRAPLKEYADAGKDVMYRTDHHWTTYGAYLAYTELLTAWGMEEEILPPDAFEIEIVSDAFYGTTWRNAGMKWIRPDVMELYRYEGDEDFTMKIHDSNTVMSGFYDRSYLEKTDKYSTFISGNRAYITIEKNGGEERERLLMVKDSFGHSLAPFLAYHFDLEIIDPRYYKKSPAALAMETGCSRVLLINNMGSLTDAVVLEMLGWE